MSGILCNMTAQIGVFLNSRMDTSVRGLKLAGQCD